MPGSVPPANRDSPSTCATCDGSNDAEHLRREVDRLRQEVDGLRLALTTRGTIDQAKGIIISQLHCTPNEAFDVLVKASQARHTKLFAIADEIVRMQGRHGGSNADERRARVGRE